MGQDDRHVYRFGSRWVREADAASFRPLNSICRIDRNYVFVGHLKLKATDPTTFVALERRAEKAAQSLPQT